MIVIPVGLVVFVKFFGTNQYELPVYYQDGYPNVQGCDKVGPGISPGFFQSSLDWKGIRVILWEPECPEKNNFFSGQTNRIRSNFEQVDIVKLISVADLELQGVEKESLAICGLLIEDQKEENLAAWRCDGFLVMLDWENKIRGYYSGSDFEDLDRLILELHVMETIIANEK